jgi:hypothetical protein
MKVFYFNKKLSDKYFRLKKQSEPQIKRIKGKTRISHVSEWWEDLL